MDIVIGLAIIAAIYLWVLFMDRFFKSCSHYAYIQFLKGTGLEIKLFQFSWTTTAFNKFIYNWGSSHTKFLRLWFNLGLCASLILLPVSIYLLFVAFFQNFSSVKKEENIIQPVVPGINLPASEISYYSITLLLSSVLHELGHALASVQEDVPLINEFAETAMNELLGWYGYGNNHREARPCRSHSGSNSSGPESPKFSEGCGWCGKAVDENTGLSSAAATFCSELCFSQSRRANFKKNKTCDWCRHVRHTVSYVDSQDGSSQLQFCSDKCLNQYKMHIFWRETRAHLEIHPHIHGEESSGTLITPDLWMNKCKSPENQISSPSSSPKLPENRQQTSPLPLITVAHPSKLMSVPLNEADFKRQRGRVQKKNKKKSIISLPSCSSNNNKLFSTEMPQDLRIRHTPPDFDYSRVNETKTKESNVVEADSRGDHSQLNNNEGVARRKLLDSLIPPPTILVPYPIILPLPIPIPIPIPVPIPNGVLKSNKNEEKKSADVSSQTEDVSSPTAPEVVEESTEKINIRPLRKRKRIVEKKSKFIIKNKKMLST